MIVEQTYILTKFIVHTMALNSGHGKNEHWWWGLKSAGHSLHFTYIYTFRFLTPITDYAKTACRRNENENTCLSWVLLVGVGKQRGCSYKTQGGWGECVFDWDRF